MAALRLLSRAGLRLRLAAALALLLTAAAWTLYCVVEEELSEAYAVAGRGAVEAMGRLFADDVDRDRLRRTASLQDALDRLGEGNPDLVGGSILAVRGDRPVRVAATGRPSGPVAARVAALRTGRAAYVERRGPDGRLGELELPLADDRGVFAVLSLSFDLAPLDRATALSRRHLLVTAGITGVALFAILLLLVARLVFHPLVELRRASRDVAAGARGRRLGWRRRDELGKLARDFDAMAAEIEAAHARLEALARLDSLTGLPNHRAFRERLGEELERWREEGRPVALVALDVDRFKAINDRFGHAAGDAALRAAAEAIRAELRPADLCARIGGDEFALALPDTDVEGARATVERVRAAVAARPLAHGAGITISAGVALLGELAGERDDVLALADAALYCAKRAGRNRCAVMPAAGAAPLAAA